MVSRLKFKCWMPPSKEASVQQQTRSKVCYMLRKAAFCPLILFCVYVFDKVGLQLKFKEELSKQRLKGEVLLSSQLDISPWYFTIIIFFLDISLDIYPFRYPFTFPQLQLRTRMETKIEGGRRYRHPSLVFPFTRQSFTFLKNRFCQIELWRFSIRVPLLDMLKKICNLFLSLSILVEDDQIGQSTFGCSWNWWRRPEKNRKSSVLFRA